jgi:methyl-accepting chemotaxis protein
LKFTYVAITCSIIVTIANIFYTNIYFSIIGLIILASTFPVLIYLTKKQKTTFENMECSFEEKIQQEKEIATRSLGKMEDRIQKTEKDHEETLNIQNMLFTLMTKLDFTIPVINKLSTVIIDKSEGSTLNATEKIFSIVGESQRVGKDIQDLLANMNIGDNSLNHEMDSLLEEVKDFQMIVDNVEQLKKSYENDMEIIENTVLNIKRLADNIADIADQTSILAINASIEAARAGNAGVGFAVIAGETQKLAKDSKQITGEITSCIKGIGGTIASSFERQSETLSTTVNHLQESKESFNQMTFALAPQIKNIGFSIQKSKELSESVTERLNEITVSLQYQDATRQILEHIIQLVENIQKDFSKLNLPDTISITTNKELLNKEVLALATKIFTVREEWLALGLVLDESKQEESDKEENLHGDITLF